MQIVIEHMINVASNLEYKVNRLGVLIEQLNTVIYNMSNQDGDRIHELIRCRDNLFAIKDKLLNLAEVVYISMNYYIRWDEAGASYCYQDKLLYPNKDKGVLDLTDIKNILEDVLK